MKKHNITQDNYLTAAQMDKQSAQAYFAKSINKTEQQKALESLLLDSVNTEELDFNKPYRIADLACGGGTLSYHLASIFPNAEFCLVDYNEDGLKLAQDINKPFANRMEFIRGDLRDLPFDSESFDLVFCWGVLLIFDKEALQPILKEVRRILKPDSKLYASNLFNTEFDVDLYTSICDHTRPSSYNPYNPKVPLINGNYNTYCAKTIANLYGDKSQSMHIVPFHPNVDFPRDKTQRGIGSFTLTLSETQTHDISIHPESQNMQNLANTSCASPLTGVGEQYNALSLNHLGWNAPELEDFDYYQIITLDSIPSPTLLRAWSTLLNVPNPINNQPDKFKNRAIA